MNAASLHLFRSILASSVLLSSGLLAQSGNKIVITKADQLPRVAYPFEGQAVELVNDTEQL